MNYARKPALSLGQSPSKCMFDLAFILHRDSLSNPMYMYANKQHYMQKSAAAKHHLGPIKTQIWKVYTTAHLSNKIIV